MKQLSVKNPGVEKINNLRKDQKGNLYSIYKVTTKINEEKNHREKQGECKSTRNVLYCNNNKCQRVVKTFDGNLIFYYKS